MIFGAMRDKALNEMGSILFPAARELILTEIDNPRGASLDMLRSAVPESSRAVNLHQASSVDEALRIARALTPPHGLICVTGSLYLVGAIQESFADQAQRVARQHAAN
jgi:dihydrofolate synthase/folylpolyglutamate synthase